MAIGHRDFFPNVTVMDYGNFYYGKQNFTISTDDYVAVQYGGPLYVYSSQLWIRPASRAYVDSVEIDIFVDGHRLCYFRTDLADEYWESLSPHGPVVQYVDDVRTRWSRYRVQGGFTARYSFEVRYRLSEATGADAIFNWLTWYYVEG